MASQRFSRPAINIILLGGLSGPLILVVSLFVIIGGGVVVGGGLLALGFPLVVAVSLAAISVATDPAAVAESVREIKATGLVPGVLLGIVAIDDGWGIIVFGLSMAVLVWVVGSLVANLSHHHTRSFREIEHIEWPCGRQKGFRSCQADFTSTTLCLALTYLRAHGSPILGAFSRKPAGTGCRRTGRTQGHGAAPALRHRPDRV